MLRWLSLALAVLAYTLLSTGLVLMKKGIDWIGHKGPRDHAFRRHRRIWLAGFAAANLYIVPSALALKHLAPHVVSAMAGWGVIILVWLSKEMLDEPLFPSDLIFACLIVSGIAVLNLLESRGGAASADAARLAAAAAIPLALLAAALIKRLGRRRRALLFAAVSGLAAGLIVVAMKELVNASGFRMAEWLASPVFYLYLASSLGAFLTLQASYKLGAMLRVGPVQYAATILYPSFCSWWVFGARLHPLQWAALGVIALAAGGMLRRH